MDWAGLVTWLDVASDFATIAGLGVAVAALFQWKKARRMMAIDAALLAIDRLSSVFRTARSVLIDGQAKFGNGFEIDVQPRGAEFLKKKGEIALNHLNSDPGLNKALFEAATICKRRLGRRRGQEIYNLMMRLLVRSRMNTFCPGVADC